MNTRRNAALIAGLTLLAGGFVWLGMMGSNPASHATSQRRPGSGATSFARGSGTTPAAGLAHAQGPAARSLGTPAAGTYADDPGARAARDRLVIFTKKKVEERTVEKEFGELLGQLKLDPAKLAALKELLVERKLCVGDAMAAAQRAGIDPGTPMYAAALSAATHDVEASMADLLGPDAYNALQSDVIRIGPSYLEVQEFIAPAMGFAEAPLTSGQKIALAQVMTDLHYSSEDTMYAQVMTEAVDPQTGLSPLFSELISRSAGFLSPSQTGILKSRQMELAAFQQMRQPRAAIAAR